MVRKAYSSGRGVYVANFFFVVYAGGHAGASWEQGVS
jgi:hypothetical protein